MTLYKNRKRRMRNTHWRRANQRRCCPGNVTGCRVEVIVLTSVTQVKVEKRVVDFVSEVVKMTFAIF